MTEAERKARKRKADRKYILKKKYGITEEIYDAMLVRQQGRCAICRKKPGRKQLAVDHDHRRENNIHSLRGLLCPMCNYYVLGNARGWTPDIFRRAADYLEHPPGVFGHPPRHTATNQQILEKNLDKHAFGR